MLSALVVLPASAYAQASLTGVVERHVRSGAAGCDGGSGEPVLIEKVRTAVTDGTGQYRIVDLRAGTYVVTFTLTGFSTVKREGIELTARSPRP